MSSFLPSKYRFSEWIKAALDSRLAGVLCFLLAFSNKIAIAWLYTDLEDDKSLYLLLSDSALKGKLLLEPVTFYHSAATEYIFSSATVSPLYSLLAVPILGITKSFVATSIVLDIISWSVFLTGLYTTAQVLFKHRWIANTFILCVGLFLYPHELASTPKDTLAVGLMLWGCYFTYKIIRSDGYHLSLVCLASAAFFLLLLTKFLYAPLALLFLLTLYINAKKSISRAQLYNAYSSFMILFLSVLFFALFLVYQKSQASPLRINSDGTEFVRGFFPENLCSTFPFISASLINTNFWGVQLERIVGISFAHVMRLFQIMDLLLMVLILSLCFHYYKKVRRIPVPLLLLGVFSLAIIFMVSAMSLLHKAIVYRISGTSYTYVQEARSFLLPIITFQLLTFYLIFKSKARPFIKLLLFSLLFLESLHGGYFTVKQMLGYDKVDARLRIGSSNKKIVNQVRELETDHQNVRLLTRENSLRRLAQVNGLNAIYFPDTCRGQSEIKFPAVVAVLQNDSITIKSCLKTNEASFRDTIQPFALTFLNF